MKFTVEINKVEENMLKALQKKEGIKGTTEEYANSFFHNHLWVVYDMYFKDHLKRESEEN